MKMTMNAWDMKREFENMDRDYFSMAGIDCLLEYYDEIDENMEFDAIAICCDCSEYGSHGAALSWNDFISDHGVLLDCGGYTPHQWDNLSDSEQKQAIEDLIEELEYHTTVLRPENGNVIVFEY